MSLSSALARNDYTGDNATSVYAYSFRIFDDDDLTIKVRNTLNVETLLVKTTDYTVSGVGTASGGNVTLVNASQAWLTSGKLTTNFIITILREVDLLQSSDFRNQGDFFPETHEDAFDYLTMIDQQQQDKIDRSLRLPDSIDPDDFDMELPSDMADHGGKSLLVNSTGDGWAFGDEAFSFTISATQPTNPSATALAFWYDKSEEQIKIWIGEDTEWRVIG